MRLEGLLTLEEAISLTDWSEEEKGEYMLAIMLFAQIAFIAETGERLFKEDITQKFGVLDYIKLPTISTKPRRGLRDCFAQPVRKIASKTGQAVIEALKEIYPVSKLQDLKTILLIDTGSALEAQGRIVPVESISYLYYRKMEM